MNLNNHLTDKKAAESGKWFDYDDGRFLIAATNTPAYQRAIAKLGKKKRAAIQRDDFSEFNAMAAEAMADTVLLGWENVTQTRDGHEVEFPYTRDNALRLLNEAQAFRQWVEATAMNLHNFVRGEEEADRADLKSADQVGGGVGPAS